MLLVLLQTENLRLLPLRPAHEDVFLYLANLPEINERINAPLPTTPNHFKAQLDGVRSKPFHFIWMMEWKGELVGVINHSMRGDPRLFQGGYWVDPRYWGNGISTAAVLLVRNYLFEECQAQRVQALVEPDNPASARVLEKCGYQFEGLLRRFYPSLRRGMIDVLMYAAVR